VVLNNCTRHEDAGEDVKEVEDVEEVEEVEDTGRSPTNVANNESLRGRHAVMV